MHAHAPSLVRPHPAAPRLAPACSTDILLQQKSPAFDERDIARNAASCMCVGSPAFTSMGKALYKGISPRLGGDTEGVTESSPQPKMKELLKVRGRAWGAAWGEVLQAGAGWSSLARWSRWLGVLLMHDAHAATLGLCEQARMRARVQHVQTLTHHEVRACTAAPGCCHA